MTLELVELLGQSLLGGTALAAARFFPSGCTRLMHALGVWGWQWGVGGGGVWSMCSCAVGAGGIQDRSTYCEGLLLTSCDGARPYVLKDRTNESLQHVIKNCSIKVDVTQTIAHDHYVGMSTCYLMPPVTNRQWPFSQSSVPHETLLLSGPPQ